MITPLCPAASSRLIGVTYKALMQDHDDLARRLREIGRLPSGQTPRQTSLQLLLIDQQYLHITSVLRGLFGDPCCGKMGPLQARLEHTSLVRMICGWRGILGISSQCDSPSEAEHTAL